MKQRNQAPEHSSHSLFSPTNRTKRGEDEKKQIRKRWRMKRWIKIKARKKMKMGEVRDRR